MNLNLWEMKARWRYCLGRMLWKKVTEIGGGGEIYIAYIRLSDREVEAKVEGVAAFHEFRFSPGLPPYASQNNSTESMHI